MSTAEITIRRLGQREYHATWQAMQEFTATRSAQSRDELWLVEHPPVYTRGRNAKNNPLNPNDIPVVPTDRGGDITYHGPGQAVVYVLIDLHRRGLGVKHLVHILEQGVIDLLADRGINGERRQGAPGVYVSRRKIAALGLRVTRGCSYHGLSLNVDMDLAPFANIHPCGYQGLEVTQLRDLGFPVGVPEASELLAHHLTRGLGYNAADLASETGT